MNYLEKYMSEEDVLKIKQYFNKDIINKFEIMEYNVCLVLDYLSSIGVKKFNNLILNRPDICFMDLELLKIKIGKFDVNLMQFVFENEVNNLMNFDI